MKLFFYSSLTKFLILFIPVFAIHLHTSYAQQSKDGPKTITNPGTGVNEYTFLTADASSGNTSITVSNSSLNTNNRFSAQLSAGDLIMIIQMQGATINGTSMDSTWGTITNYNNCGLYEFSEVASVPNGTTINLNCSLKNNYTMSGKVQVVRVPQFSTLTVNSGGTVTSDTWNGASGGIIAIEVQGATVINAGGTVDASGQGFRGGALVGSSGNTDSIPFFATSAGFGGEKGESIAGYQTDYNAYGGMFGRGAPANGAGGGDQWNASGGGGANAGNISAYTGNGNPDTSTPAWKAAWNLEYNGFANATSSGGGRGGYTIAWFPQGTPNPLVTGTNNSLWGGTDRNRQNAGGKGGRPLDYSTGRIFDGGGGGAGHEDQNLGGAGGNGGGIVYLLSYGGISGSGSILSNGQNGLPDNSTNQLGDGCGGAGGGGTVILYSAGTISGITVNADGGAGGNQYITSSYEAEGPGGGGGGGYVATSGATITSTADGGINGTTNSPLFTLFPPDGATKGGAGFANEAINNIPFSSVIAGVSGSVSLCSGASIPLTASGGATYLWTPATGLSSSTIANPIANPSVTTTYIVTVSSGSCSATDSVIITVGQGFKLNVSPTDTAICSGSATFRASGANAYLWSPSIGLNCVSCANPTASPLTSTTYYVVGSNGGCSYVDTVTLSVGSKTIGGIVTALRDTLCQGTPGNLTLTAFSGSPLQWQSSATPGNFADISSATDTSFQTLPLLQSTWYRVAVGNGNCASVSDSLLIFVPPALYANFATTQSGNTITFNSDSSTGNIISYHWTFGDGGSSSAQNPSHTFAKTDTLYNVCLSVYDGSNCSYTFCKDVSLITGTATVSMQTNWNIYPNPFNNKLYIGGKSLTGQLESIELYNVLGQMVLNKNISNAIMNPLTVDVPEGLPEGMYYLKIKTKESDYLQPVMKQ